MKSIFSIVVLILLSQNVVFAEGNYEDTRRISQSNVNYRDLLYVYYKGTKTELTDEILTNYINDFYEDDYKNHRQNEFEWPAVINKHRTELTSKINEANLSTVYTFQTGASFGTYNFEKEGFDVGIDMEYLFVARNGLSVEQGRVDTDLNSKAILIFVNDINSYNFFKIERNKANALVNSRTSNGNVNRNITLHISFTINNFFPDVGLFLIAQMNNSISARITKIDIYDGPNKIGELSSVPNS